MTQHKTTSRYNLLVPHKSHKVTNHHTLKTQKHTSVRVFYSKHENKMYPEPQTRLRQAQTDSNLQTITVIASEEQTKQSLHCYRHCKQSEAIPNSNCHAELVSASHFHTNNKF